MLHKITAYVKFNTHKLTSAFLICISLMVCMSNQASASQLVDEYISPIRGYDVIIDVGHGGIDGGTGKGDILEKNLNLEIGAKLYYWLKSKGFLVGITRIHDYALSDDSFLPSIHSRHKRDLMQRKLIADGVNPLLFISIHINYSPRSSIKGPLILYQDQAESFLLAELIQRNLNQLAQTSKASVHGKNYFLTKHVSPPCLIAEVGYISHPTEFVLLQHADYQEEIAQQIGEAIQHFFTLYP